jgi:hypothetical protein
MSDLKDLTDDELKRISEELKQGHTIESGLLARFKMRRRTKLNKEATSEMTSALVRNITAAALEDSHQRILQERSLNVAKAQTATMAESLKQAQIQDEQDELQAKAIERQVRLALIERAAHMGLDLPTYLEVVKANLIQSGEGEVKLLMENIKAAIAVENFDAHMQIDLLREELSGLYTQRTMLESMPDSQIKKDRLKDISEQIKAMRRDKRGRERRLVEENHREDEGTASPKTETNRDVRKKTDS